eukprot:2352265-Amphidinium_carterae.1
MNIANGNNYTTIVNHEYRYEYCSGVKEVKESGWVWMEWSCKAGTQNGFFDRSCSLYRRPSWQLAVKASPANAHCKHGTDCLTKANPPQTLAEQL